MHKCNEAEIAKLKPGQTKYFAGAIVQGKPAPRGFGVRMSNGGTISFVLRYARHGKDRFYTLGQFPDWGIAQAVARLREVRQQIDLGHDPRDERRAEAEAVKAAARDRFQAICESYMALAAGRMRTAADEQRTLERLVYPALGERAIGDIKRLEIARLLDKIQTENGATMADRTLARIRAIMNWHATRDDEFCSPIVRGMARTKPHEQARQRILADEEIRAVWEACETYKTTFGDLLRFILLTAARRNEAMLLPWSEIKPVIHDGKTYTAWVLPAARNKAKVELARPLPPAVLALLPETRHSTWVFPGREGAPCTGYTNMINAIKRSSGTAGWTIHDLRRTARSLMPRAGVSDEIAEQCLGHKLAGVRGVYNVYKYLPEMHGAYQALAALIMRIVNRTSPAATGNVVPLKRAASSRARRASA